MKRPTKSGITKLSAAVVTALTMAHIGPAFASGSDLYDGSKARHNLSNKLELLSQSVGASSCRIKAGIGVEQAQAELYAARKEFLSILNTLENGNPSRGVPAAEKHRDVQRTLQALRATWEPIYDASETLISGGANSSDAAQSILTGLPELQAGAQKLTMGIKNRYSNPNELKTNDALALDVAGNIRMLGQKISKEVCGIAMGDETVGTPESLEKSVTTYSASLRALRDGMAAIGVSPPPNGVIRSELTLVQSSFSQNEDMLAAISGGMQPTPENVETLASASSDLTTDMSSVVTLYILATPGQAEAYRLPVRTYAETQLKSWIENPDLIAAILAQNEAHASLSQSDIDTMDQTWRAERKAESSPMIDDVLARPVSAWLREQQAESYVTEVFVMDNLGLNVAQSLETSDYWQGDEDKWRKTFGNGSGDMHISDIELDESTGTYQAQVSLAVEDPATGELIGAITFGVNIPALL